MIGQRFYIYAARTPGPPDPRKRGQASMGSITDSPCQVAPPAGATASDRFPGAGVGRELDPHCRFASLTGSGTQPNGLPTGRRVT
jgi:hypothetical protein